MVSRRVRALIQQTRDKREPWQEVRDAFVVEVFAFKAIHIHPLFGVVANLPELHGAHQQFVEALRRHLGRDERLWGTVRALETILHGLTPLRLPLDNAYSLEGRENIAPILRELGYFLVQRFGVMQAPEQLLELLARSESPLVPARG